MSVFTALLPKTKVYV